MLFTLLGKPDRLLDGCSDGTGGTGASVIYPVTPTIVFSTSGLSLGESIVAGESFTVTAAIKNPAKCIYSNSNISMFSLEPASSSISVGSCTIQTTLSSYGAGVSTFPCQSKVSIENNATPGTYYLIMQNQSYNFPNPVTVSNVWWSAGYECWLYQFYNQTYTGPFYLLESNEIIPFTVIAPTSESKYIFLTESTYNGNMGGAAGINTKCQNDSNNPLKLNTNKGSWATTGKSPVFNTSESYIYWTAESINGTFIPESINFTENADWVKPLVVGASKSKAWYNPTNITPSSYLYSCTGWMVDGGKFGNAASFNSSAVKLTDAQCNATRHIICVEQ